MRIKHIHIFIIILIIIAGGIWLSDQLGLFETRRSAAANPLRGGGQGQRATLAGSANVNTSIEREQQDKLIIEEVIEEGVYNPADIRGSLTLLEVERLYQVPPAGIIESFNLEEDTDPAGFRLRDLKEFYEPYEIDGETYEVETDTIKVFVSLYTNIPYTSDETFYLPERAVNYLIRENRLTPEEESYWKYHTFNLASLARDRQVIEADEGKMFSLTGNTTIADLFSMGIDEDAFKEITGMDVPEDKTITVRNFVFSHGMGFDDISEDLELFFSSNKH